MTLTQTNTLTLYGQTMTIPQYQGTSTSVQMYGNSLTSSNVILAMSSTTPTGNTYNTLNINDNLVLQNSQNVIAAGAENGNSKGTFGQTLNISGAVSYASAGTSTLTFYGGGNANNDGALIAFTGNDTLNANSNSMIILGQAPTSAIGNEGADVSFTSNAYPTTGTLVVNEQSQVVLQSGVSNNFGAGTTLILNGGGMGPGVSQGSSGALRTNGSNGNYTFQGNVVFGTGTTDTLALGFVVISATSGNTVTFSNAVSGSGSLQKQGGGIIIFSGTPGADPWGGGLQMGNGQVETTSNSAIGTGPLQFAQSSTNNPTVILNNPTQTIGGLSSEFTGTTSGTLAQTLELNGTALTINESANAPIKTFGTGAVSTLTSVITDGTTANGSVTYSGTSATAQLSFTDNNTYTGGTTVTSGILNLANGPSGSARDQRRP